MKAIDKKYFKKLIGNLRREIRDLFPQVMEAHMLRDHLMPEKCSKHDYKKVPTWRTGELICPLCAIDDISGRTDFMRGKPEPPKGAQAGIVTAHCETCRCYPKPEPGSVEKCLDPLKCCRHNSQSEYYIGKKCVTKCDDPDCVVCGEPEWVKSFKRFSDPTPPLRALVAKALGRQVNYWRETRDRHADWLQIKKRDENKIFILQAWEPVPDPTKSVKLAMGAFWTYLASLGVSAYGGISFGAHGQGQIYIESWVWNFEYVEFGEIPPDKLCEAIVKHSEGK